MAEYVEQSVPKASSMTKVKRPSSEMRQNSIGKRGPVALKSPTDEALDQSGDIWFLAEAYRVKGELLKLLAQANNVEECFSQALKVAQA